jgi:hypothetical protein
MSQQLRSHAFVRLLLLLVPLAFPVLACDLVVIRITETPPAVVTSLPNSPTPLIITAQATAFTVVITATPFMTQTSGPSATPLPTLALPYEDASNLMVGVCFKYLATLDGQNIDLASNGDLVAFYTAVNKSKKCADAAPTSRFDFSAKEVVGTVITGQGCDISLTYDRTDQNDAARQRQIVMHSSITGDCGYLLVEPLLIAIDRKPGYKTQVVIVKSP